MALTSVDLAHDYGDGYPDRTEYVRVFEAVSDSVNDTPHTVGASTMLPQVGMPYPSNPHAILLHVHPERSQESPLAWIVTCNYSTKLPAEIAQAAINPSTGGENPLGEILEALKAHPLNQPARWVAKTVKQTVAVERDRKGKLIKNSAGERIMPPITRRKSRLCLEVTKNLPSDYGIVGTFADYVDHVNKETYLGFPPQHLYLEDAHAETGYDRGVRFITVHATLIVDRDGWRWTGLDAGYHQKVNGKLVPIFIRGQIASTPQPLNGAGVYDKDAEYYLTREIYPEADFDELGLF
jgi:hypothetical protein